VHPSPSHAKSDGPNMVALRDFEKVFRQVLAHDALAREQAEA
jgi:2-dehydro-3-deoxyphosphooctonate aldolase (KDO 8-P synthase)